LTFKEELISMLLKLFNKIGSEGTLQNLFYEARINHIETKSDKLTKIVCREQFLVNIGENMFNKIFSELNNTLKNYIQ
jgi:hypothetical protein